MAHMFRFWLTGLLLAGLSCPAFPDSATAGSATAGSNRLVVIELYTSQGCPACPPADAFLGELGQRSGLLTLGFHVDYWDAFGWPDPHAAPQFTRRQKMYTGTLDASYVFTPQMVINGRRHGAGTDRTMVERLIDRSRDNDDRWVTIDLAWAVEGIAVRLAAVADIPVDADLYLVRYEGPVRTAVTNGENQGADLVNHNVVRDVRPVASWKGGDLSLVIPVEPGLDAAASRYAVLLQDRDSRHIIGAARLENRLSPGP